MRNRQEKCPVCGLANFRDEAECQWCALALSDRARNDYVDDAPPDPGRPWGLLLMLFAVLAVGVSLAWHVQRKAAERAESAAEQAEAADDSAELPERAGPPSLSGRGPGDPPRAEFSSISEMIEKNQRERKYEGQNPYRNYDFARRPAAREQMRRDAAGGEWEAEDQQRGPSRRPESTPPGERDDQ